MPPIDLQNKTAIVTGASRGIGLAVAKDLVQSGMRVIITGRHENTLNEAAASLDAADQVIPIVCDQHDPAAIEALMQAAKAEFPALYLLVNNAGIGVFGPCDEVTLEEWDRVLDTNARGAFLLSQATFCWMRETGGGRIVNISSVTGHKGYVNQAAYAASKHAMMGFTKVMAREGQEHDIRVAAICPGGVATALVGDARPDLDMSGMIQPEDIAYSVHYLATEAATCVTDFLYVRRAGSTPFA